MRVAVAVCACVWPHRCIGEKNANRIFFLQQMHTHAKKNEKSKVLWQIHDWRKLWNEIYCMCLWLWHLPCVRCVYQNEERSVGSLDRLHCRNVKTPQIIDEKLKLFRCVFLHSIEAKRNNNERFYPFIFLSFFLWFGVHGWNSYIIQHSLVSNWLGKTHESPMPMIVQHFCFYFFFIHKTWQICIPHTIMWLTHTFHRQSGLQRMK